MRRACAAALTAMALLPQAFADDLPDVDYQIGNGLRIPALGLSIGGYATGVYERPRGLPPRTALDDLSFSVWWEGADRWKVFSEFDYQNGVSSRSPKEGEERRYLALERFYVDYSLNDLATLRVGKFLTPIGRWNLLHASPLVWTTSRPLVTTLAFPTNVTGAMVTGSVSVAGMPLDYNLYGSLGTEVRPNPAIDTFHRALGSRFVFAPLRDWQVGFSYVTFSQDKTPDEHGQLAGVDIRWARGGYEVTAEGIYRRSSQAADRSEKGAFVQFVIPLADRLHAVTRYEIYRHAPQGPSTRLWVVGLTTRLTPAVVLKAEWVSASHNGNNAPEGFLSSISVIF